MARNIDPMIDDFIQLKNLSSDLSKMEREARLLREKRDALQNTLIKKMGKSIIGNFEGKPFVEVDTTTRKSATIALVMEHAPEKKDLLIKKTDSQKIKFI